MLPTSPPPTQEQGGVWPGFPRYDGLSQRVADSCVPSQWSLRQEVTDHRVGGQEESQLTKDNWDQLLPALCRLWVPRGQTGQWSQGHSPPTGGYLVFGYHGDRDGRRGATLLQRLPSASHEEAPGQPPTQAEKLSQGQLVQKV